MLVHTRLAEVAAALRKTTEILALELAAPTKEPPCWTEFEWRIARAVTAMHGVSALLRSRLGWAGPGSWRRFLDEQRDQAVERHRQITRLLDAVNLQASRAGMMLVALKGAALYASDIYAPGERPMGDVDLLIQAEDANRITQLLEACDYAAAFTTGRHQVFIPRVRKAMTGTRLGEHIDNPIKIEVHTRIAEHLPVTASDITQFLWPSVEQPGLITYRSIACLMMHLLLHAAGNMRARALRLIQLHDIALLSARFEQSDWEELFAMRPNGCGIWWALAPLTLTALYYPNTIQAAVFDRLRAECPHRLVKHMRRQRLTDVSWSNIRIEAFPGVEWARSPREALIFMSNRIWPSYEARLELKLGAAQIPDSSTVPWYGISHAARILRWVISRPPRVQTLLSVRAALAQEF